MTDTDCELIVKLAEALAHQKYSPVVVGNYCRYARAFLDYLAGRDMPVTKNPHRPGQAGAGPSTLLS